MAPCCFDNIVGDNKIYKVGTALRIIDESCNHSYYNTIYLQGQSGMVSMYSREENHSSHHVAVYVLLDKFKASGPLVVTKVMDTL